MHILAGINDTCLLVAGIIDTCLLVAGINDRVGLGMYTT